MTFFIPVDAPLFTKFDEIASRVPRTKTYFFISAVCSVILVIVASQFSTWLREVFILLGLFYAGVLCLLLLKGRSRKKHEILGFRPRLCTHYFFLFLMALNGSAAYLGLQTDNVFSMFSNLRTEGGKTNHLFIPAWTQIFDYQKEVVIVVDDQNRKLGQSQEFQRSRTGPIGYVHLDFTGLVQWLATTNESFQPVTYSYKGDTQNVSSLKDVDDLFVSYSWIERKVLKFRGVRIGAAKCDH
jgi:Ca2+/Na+ antiporter